MLRPEGGWPERVSRVVLGEKRFKERQILAPHVSAGLRRLREALREYSDVSVLPTPAFFYGLKPARKSPSTSRRARP
jgi:hypothetical protein